MWLYFTVNWPVPISGDMFANTMLPVTYIPYIKLTIYINFDVLTTA